MLWLISLTDAFCKVRVWGVNTYKVLRYLFQPEPTHYSHSIPNICCLSVAVTQSKLPPSFSRSIFLILSLTSLSVLRSVCFLD